jgi:hypothetical protein
MCLPERDKSSVTNVSCPRLQRTRRSARRCAATTAASGAAYPDGFLIHWWRFKLWRCKLLKIGVSPRNGVAETSISPGSPIFLAVMSQLHLVAWPRKPRILGCAIDSQFFWIRGYKVRFHPIGKLYTSNVGVTNLSNVSILLCYLLHLSLLRAKYAAQLFRCLYAASFWHRRFNLE